MNDDDSDLAGFSDNTSVSKGESNCPCACCQKYQELINWADYLEEIAAKIEDDEWYYLTVKADIVENGWESDFARIGISGYRDPTIPNRNEAALIQHFEGTEPEVIFAEDLTPAVLNNSVARPGLIRIIRERAAYARALADRGLEYCRKNPPYVGQNGSDLILDYFCSLDPDKINDDVWGELYKIGYIDFATYNDIGYNVLSERLARAELIASVLSLIFIWRRALTSLAKNSAHGLLRLTRVQANRLVNIGRRRMPNRVRQKVDLRRGSPAARADAEAGISNGFMGYGHATPWSKMSAKAKKEFQHSYSRHAAEFGLPAWRQSIAADLQIQFNSAVRQVVEKSHRVMISYHPYKSVSAQMTEWRAIINGREYYYYQLRDIGKFVSAGLVR